MTDEIDRQLLDALRGGAAAYGLFGPDERLRDANAPFLRNFDTALEGAPLWEDLMRRCHARRRGLVVDAEDMDAWIARVRRSHRKVPVRSFESDLTDGRWMWVTETLRPDGWLLVVMSDVTALKASEATLRLAHDRAVLASLTDSFTGLYNRRYVFNRLADLLASARSMRIPLAAVVVDLDHFKAINDTRGQSAGDAVLLHFAQLVKSQLRPLDVAGRTGGEEFLLLLPNTSGAGAMQLLARLRAQAAQADVPAGGAPGYTFSAGVTVAAAADDGDAIVRRADDALYLAKGSGRNRDEFRDPPTGG